jgi:hypothetical protein
MTMLLVNAVKELSDDRDRLKHDNEELRPRVWNEWRTRSLNHA